ncbi:hypothetical protein [Aliiroseovarius sediminis]|uniref:hypothetical protein n=1 Tax=Aliiroseovarius sediminis TaxID=2925839 RepID=UPI001F5AC937|nr:hypothetical protein [Aliiroseovarius sediminis]MCI2393260.1 hypothetical protein [Aliiroseovarius sediminis]
MRSHPSEKPTLLALGPDGFLDSLCIDTYRITHQTFDSFAKITAAECDEQQIRVVLSPLFSPQMDCIEIGYVLDTIGFQGVYLIHADTLPNPRIILREMRQLYPQLDVQVVTPDEVAQFMNGQQQLAGQ